VASDEFLSGAHDLVSWDRNRQTWHRRLTPCLPVAVGGQPVRRSIVQLQVYDLIRAPVERVHELDAGAGEILGVARGDGIGNIKDVLRIIDGQPLEPLF
jgi:hypothetical protein